MTRKRTAQEWRDLLENGMTVDQIQELIDRVEELEKLLSKEARNGNSRN